MAVSCMRVDMDMTRVLIVSLFVSDLGPSLFEVRLPIIRRRERIDHQRSNRREHRDESREREVVPRFFRQPLRAQVLEGVRKDVDEARRQDHAGGKGLDQEEDVLVRVESRNSPAENWDTHANCTGGEYRNECGDLVLERFTFVSVFFFGFTLALPINHGGEDHREAAKKCKLLKVLHVREPKKEYATREEKQDDRQVNTEKEDVEGVLLYTGEKSLSFVGPTVIQTD